MCDQIKIFPLFQIFKYIVDYLKADVIKCCGAQNRTELGIVFLRHTRTELRADCGQRGVEGKLAMCLSCQCTASVQAPESRWSSLCLQPQHWGGRQEEPQGSLVSQPTLTARGLGKCESLYLKMTSEVVTPPAPYTHTEK